MGRGPRPGPAHALTLPTCSGVRLPLGRPPTRGPKHLPATRRRPGACRQGRDGRTGLETSAELWATSRAQECGFGLIPTGHWICCLSRNSEREARRPARELRAGDSLPHGVGPHLSCITRNTFQRTETRRDRWSRPQGGKCRLSFAEGPAVLSAWASPGSASEVLRPGSLVPRKPGRLVTDCQWTSRRSRDTPDGQSSTFHT